MNAEIIFFGIVAMTFGFWQRNVWAGVFMLGILIFLKTL